MDSVNSAKDAVDDHRTTILPAYDVEGGPAQRQGHTLEEV